MAMRGAVSFCSALVRWFGSSLKPLGAVAKLENSHAPGEEFLGWTNSGMFPSPNSAVLPWKHQKTISAQWGKRKSALQATAAIATFQVFPVSWHLRKTRDDSPPDASGDPKKNRHRPWCNLGTPIRSYQCLPVSPHHNVISIGKCRGPRPCRHALSPQQPDGVYAGPWEKCVR